MFEGQPFGKKLKLVLTGESHSPEMTFSLEGFPGGFAVDTARLEAFMERRAPGRNALSTSRKEPDKVEFTAGVGSSGITTGGRIEGKIANTDVRSSDYATTSTVPRPGHADFGQWAECGAIPPGGGSNSGRMTALLCAAGGLCLQYLSHLGVVIKSRVESIGGTADGFKESVLAAARDGDSVGGVISCSVEGLAPGIGGALFAGLESHLAAAVFAVPGVKGVEFGNGFAAGALRGSENNDPFTVMDGRVVTLTNNHGGLLGGRTTGMPLVIRAAMKPTPSIFKEQQSVDLETMLPAVCRIKGRHDPCIAIRALPVLEAVTALALMDAVLESRAARPPVCLTLTAPTPDGCLEQFGSQYPFAQFAEIRADLLDAQLRGEAAGLARSLPVPVILTFRRKRDGGAFEGPEAERISFFEKMLADEDCPFAYVDFEDDFRIAGLERAAASRGVRIIRSLHCFEGPVRDVVAECRRLKGATGEIPKIACMARDDADVEEFFAQSAGFDMFDHILCMMGEAGLPTRIEAWRTGSMLVYASTGGLSGIGHLSAKELTRRCAAAFREKGGA